MPYIQNAMSFTVEVVVGLYLIAVILRFLFQLLRVDFRNPISQIIVTLTRPPLNILRRFIPGFYGIDLSSIVLMIAVAAIKIGLLVSLSGIALNAGGVLVLAIGEALNILTWALIIAILASAVLSWVAPRSMNPAAMIVNQLSDPVLRPFRRIIPSFSGIDLSPILALLALNLVLRLVVHPVMDAGRKLFF